MISSKPIEVHFNKTKLSLMLISSLIFISAGAWLVWHTAVTPSSPFGQFYFGFIMGSISVLVLGSVAVHLFKKVLDKKPGLVITDDGIIDNTGALSIGFIPWIDVVQIEEVFTGSQNLIHIKVINPLKYIHRQENALRRKLMKANYKLYGYAIGITVHRLNCSHIELLNLLQTTFNKYSHL